MKPKLKVSRVGWVPRNVSIKKVFYPRPFGGTVDLSMVFTDRKSKDYWDYNGWPPRKVRVTVEEI